MSEGGIHVLVIEDDALTAEAHAAYLGRLDGFHLAGIAHTAAEAIRRLQRDRQPDGTVEGVELILLDVNLPDGNGIALCRSLRAAGVEVDVIAITAVREAAVVRSAVSLGIVNYLIKPFGFAAFAEKLNAYRQYRQRVVASDLADQQAVDASFAALHVNPNAPLAKGMSPETLALVREEIGRHPESGLSASEVADRLRLSRVTARRYLEHLSAAGLLERGNRYGTPGRPEVEYRRPKRPLDPG